MSSVIALIKYASKRKIKHWKVQNLKRKVLEGKVQKNNN